MKGLTLAAFSIIALTTQGASLRADDSQSAQIKALTEKVRQLEERVQRLEQLAGPAKVEMDAKARATALRKRFTDRATQDLTTYTQDERQEIENLYQVANKQWRTPEAKESLKKLTDKYSKANRTGCAILYLGQMTTGEEKENYLKTAIADFGDCFYGDGVQVGAYARFLLAHYYQQSGKNAEANSLFAEIRKSYPDAVDHRGNLLVDAIPN